MCKLMGISPLSGMAWRFRVHCGGRTAAPLCENGSREIKPVGPGERVDPMPDPSQDSSRGRRSGASCHGGSLMYPARPHHDRTRGPAVWFDRCSQILLALLLAAGPTAQAGDEGRSDLDPSRVLEGLRSFYAKSALPDGSFRPGIDPAYGGMSDSAASDLAPIGLCGDPPPDLRLGAARRGEDAGVPARAAAG